MKRIPVARCLYSRLTGLCTAQYFTIMQQFEHERPKHTFAPVRTYTRTHGRVSIHGTCTTASRGLDPFRIFAREGSETLFTVVRWRGQERLVKATWIGQVFAKITAMFCILLKSLQRCIHMVIISGSAAEWGSRFHSNFMMMNAPPYFFFFKFLGMERPIRLE